MMREQLCYQESETQANYLRFLVLFGDCDGVLSHGGGLSRLDIGDQPPPLNRC